MVQKRLMFLGLSYWGGIGTPAGAVGLLGGILTTTAPLIVAASVLMILSIIAGSFAWGWDQNHDLKNPDPLWQKTLKPKKMDNDEFTRFMEWQALGEPGHRELG